ncbi:TonB-dependent receptor plug domain-containing protein [Allosphingosinicella vermicomposti]|uniref:TonB-dependent receptor plug domain-containing protein n=1 Tax=Allosphingosinicella vermicomposti TaxID=614671 RepID=UPI000D103F79|nr:TonB-dependent receptor [Allosphingosinicella vermicomposti]
MNRLGLLGTSALRSSAVFGLALVVAAPAVAQDTTTDEVEVVETAEQGEGEIVVTGSRIRRDEYSTIEPITVVTAEEITQAGFNSATDALQSNAVTAGSGQINNYYGGFVTDGGTGANTLGLRNLGPARTLILLNGRRLSPAGTRGSVLAADLNVLPTAIVERIEVLKAGASSVYGSDAVAGVVNIITDQKVRGLSIEAQVNVPEVGAGVDRRVAATFGFGTTRLNIIGSLEYRKRDGFSINDASFTGCPIPGYLDGEGSEFGSADPYPIGDPRNCFTIDNGGATINTLGVPTRDAIGRTSGVVGRFNRLVPDASVTTGPTPGYAGVGLYDRDSYDPAMGEEYVVTPTEIYTGFFSGTYDLDALGNAELYGEVLATRRKSSAYLYRQLSLDYLRGSPLLPTEFRNGAFLAPNETSSGQIVAARAFIGFGLTDSRQNVDYVRAGGGIRGDFALPGWRYDAYIGKSWTDATYEVESFLIDRIANSLLVTQNTDGTFSCTNAATFANCVAAPELNADTIGGRLPQAYRDYILANTVGTNKFRETTFAVGIDGPIFALPGGDAQLAIGAEYRQQRIDDTPDENAINGNLLGLTSSLPTRGTDSVREVFGEVFLPILSNRPFFENLNLNASARYTDYESYGSDVTYKIAGEWEVVRGFGLRASYGTSYRAPALAEQFLGATSGFLGAGTDPCDSDNFPSDPSDYSANDQLVAQNCAAVGLDVTTFVQNNSIKTFTRGGAEFGLEAETSTNWSVGAVARPTLGSAGSLSLALDYFDIKVENGVSSLGAGTILNRCYGDTAFDPDAGFCRFVVRDANNELEVNSDYVNLSTDIVKGFEFNARYAVDVFDGRFTLNANVTKYTEQSSRLFPEEYLTDANGTYVTPDWVGSFDATFRTGKVTFRYGLDWIDSSSGTYDYFAYDEQTGQVDEDLAQAYRDSYILEVPDYFLHSASVQFNVAEDFELTAGVRNLFDKQPPRISAAVNTIGNAPLYSGYDYIGRSFFVNTAFKF